MAQEEITIQTADEVSGVDYMRKTNNIINAQAEEIENNMNTVSDKLDIILDNTATLSPTTTSADVDLSEVTELIENIDTTIVESNTQDILVKINDQQEQINDIKDKLDLILNKL